MIFYLSYNERSNKILLNLTDTCILGGDGKSISGGHCIQWSKLNIALIVDCIIGHICAKLVKFGLVVKIVHGRRNDEDD